MSCNTYVFIVLCVWCYAKWPLISLAVWPQFIAVCMCFLDLFFLGFWCHTHGMLLPMTCNQIFAATHCIEVFDQISEPNHTSTCTQTNLDLQQVWMLEQDKKVQGRHISMLEQKLQIFYLNVSMLELGIWFPAENSVSEFLHVRTSLIEKQ